MENSGNTAWCSRPILLARFLTIVILMSSMLWGQRPCCEGNLWLKWTKDRRESYVWGYMTGYSHAFWKGCRLAIQARPKGTAAEEANSACRAHEPDFSKGTDYWAKQVTDFYKTFPEDRDIYIDEVLEQLGNGQSLEQIHTHPFMRHSSPGPEGGV